MSSASAKGGVVPLVHAECMYVCFLRKSLLWWLKNKGNRSEKTLAREQGAITVGLALKRIGEERIERERLSKMCFRVCGGCLVMEKGVVDVQGAERVMDMGGGVTGPKGRG